MSLLSKLKEWNRRRRSIKYTRDFKRGFSWASDQRQKGATLEDLQKYTQQSDLFGVFGAFDDGITSYVNTIRRIESTRAKVPRTT